MNVADRLLMTIEAFPSSVREGADSLALLYRWRRDGGDGPGFMAAIQSLHAQSLVEILPGADMRLRLTVDGFAQLDATLPIETSEGASGIEADASADESAWRGGVANARETPPEELVAVLRNVFAILAVPVDHAVSADTLSKIWTMEGKRGGDLRVALDAMSAAGELVIQRGEHTVFILTAAGASRIAKPN